MPPHITFLSYVYLSLGARVVHILEFTWRCIPVGWNPQKSFDGKQHHICPLDFMPPPDFAPFLLLPAHTLYFMVDCHCFVDGTGISWKALGVQDHLGLVMGEESRIH